MFFSLNYVFFLMLLLLFFYVIAAAAFFRVFVTKSYRITRLLFRNVAGSTGVYVPFVTLAFITHHSRGSKQCLHSSPWCVVTLLLLALAALYTSPDYS